VYLLQFSGECGLFGVFEPLILALKFFHILRTR